MFQQLESIVDKAGKLGGRIHESYSMLVEYANFTCSQCTRQLPSLFSTQKPQVLAPHCFLPVQTPHVVGVQKMALVGLETAASQSQCRARHNHGQKFQHQIQLPRGTKRT